MDDEDGRSVLLRTELGCGHVEHGTWPHVCTISYVLGHGDALLCCLCY